MIPLPNHHSSDLAMRSFQFTQKHHWRYPTHAHVYTQVIKLSIIYAYKYIAHFPTGMLSIYHTQLYIYMYIYGEIKISHWSEIVLFWDSYIVTPTNYDSSEVGVRSVWGRCEVVRICPYIYMHIFIIRTFPWYSRIVADPHSFRTRQVSSHPPNCGCLKRIRVQPRHDMVPGVTWGWDSIPQYRLWCGDKMNHSLMRDRMGHIMEMNHLCESMDIFQGTVPLETIVFPRFWGVGAKLPSSNSERQEDLRKLVRFLVSSASTYQWY